MRPSGAMHIITLPDRHGLNGPITTRRLARLLLIYIACYAIGLLFFQFAYTPPWQAFGLGLMIPGGGFLAYAGIACWQGIAHLFLAGFAFTLFVAAVVLWFATGNVLLPPRSWLSPSLHVSRSFAASGKERQEETPIAT